MTTCIYQNAHKQCRSKRGIFEGDFKSILKGFTLRNVLHGYPFLKVSEASQVTRKTDTDIF